MFGEWTVGKPVKAAASPFQLAAGCEAREVYPRDAHFIQIAGAQHTLLAGQMK